MARKILVAIDGAETTPRVLEAVKELVLSLAASESTDAPVTATGGNGAAGLPQGVQPASSTAVRVRTVAAPVEVTLLHVVPPYLESMRVCVPRVLEELLDVEELLRTVEMRQGEAVVEEAAQKLREAGIEARAKVQVGSPAESICREAVSGGYHLVVLGRRKLSRWQELFTDRVTDYVHRHCPVPVLVVA